MECCGAKCTTPFCPFCGKRINDGLWSLLGHVKTRLQIHRSHLAVRQEKGWPTSDAQRAVAKWQRWEEALMDAIEKSDRLQESPDGQE